MVPIPATFTTEVPDLTLPEAPEWQPGDDEQVEVLLGEMRRALYYYELVPILMDYGNEVKGIAIEASDHLEEAKVYGEQQRVQKIMWMWGFVAVSSMFMAYTIANEMR